MDRDKFKLAVLASGRGSNLQAIIEQQSHYGSYQVSSVFSDNQVAPALALAEQNRIPATLIDPATLPSKSAFHQMLLDELTQLSPDLVVLAGFMRIIKPELVSAFENRIINIHPSLLPNFPGLNTHQRALSGFHSGEITEHGCTVHLVDFGVDTGKMIAQAALTVSEGDTADSLAARVLELEHRLYPWVIAQLSSGQIVASSGKLSYSQLAVTEASRHGFRLPKGSVIM